MGREVFAARRSAGSLWLIGSALFVAVLCARPLYSYREIGPAATTLVIALLVVVAVPTLAFAWWLPSMRYELGDRELALICGPIRYVIPLDSIRSIEQRDLTPSLLTSFRLPGVALFKVPYVGVGRIRMCATGAANDLTVIDTDRGLYGITPEDPAGFTAAVGARRSVRA